MIPPRYEPKPPWHELNISLIIMELETIAHEREDGLVSNELTAQRLAEVGELCFRLSSRIRHGDA